MVARLLDSSLHPLRRFDVSRDKPTGDLEAPRQVVALGREFLQLRAGGYLFLGIVLGGVELGHLAHLHAPLRWRRTDFSLTRNPHPRMTPRMIVAEYSFGRRIASLRLARFSSDISRRVIGHELAGLSASNSRMSGAFGISDARRRVPSLLLAWLHAIHVPP